MILLSTQESQETFAKLFGSLLTSVGSEEARLRAGLRPPLKLHVQFSRMQLSRRFNFRDASEGINRTRLTSPYSPYRVRRGSRSQPALRQCLQRCDQIRQTIHRSRRLKSCRTWARL